MPAMEDQLQKCPNYLTLYEFVTLYYDYNFANPLLRGRFYFPVS